MIRIGWPTVLLSSLLAGASPEVLSLPGLHHKVEILRDRWGVPHIYAEDQQDLFFANGYMNARDRMFQIDLWRRIASGTLSEVSGVKALGRDRAARLIRFRGDWDAEWTSYADDTKEICTAFSQGVNAYIRSRQGRWTKDFIQAGYAPGPWSPEVCASRAAALGMTHNAVAEITRAMDANRMGLDALLHQNPPAPAVHLKLPAGLRFDQFHAGILGELQGLLRRPALAGSNNWVVDGSQTETGRPLLASDPHRAIEIPSLRRSIHLSAPGWNVIGSGEPALPGVAIGHNEHIAWGFTIVGTDQQDIYVERLNPANRNQYWYKGAWKTMSVESEQIPIRGESPRTVELKFTLHGPVLFEEQEAPRAYVLKWVGADPGGAAYLGMLSGARATNWKEFTASMARFRTPSENMVYADREGNIGWVVAGVAPIRKNWSGLLPVPGTGEYEWNGYLNADQLPRSYNPARHYLATANHNILPPNYPYEISHTWAPAFRITRIQELLDAKHKWTQAEFQNMQFDVLSLPARRFQEVVRRWVAPDDKSRDAVRLLMAWDAKAQADSAAALLFELWFSRIPAALFGPELARVTSTEVTLSKLEHSKDLTVLGGTLAATLADLEKNLGADPKGWKWGQLNKVGFIHVLGEPFNRGPWPRNGDPFTVNVAGLSNTGPPSGASYRHVIDLSDWDRATMTNAPGESGDPESRHYDDLVQDWLAGRYHPMPFSRAAVEAVTEEKIILTPQ